MAESLSGAWTGIYFYHPDPIWNPNDECPPTAFTASITDRNGIISGRTCEPDYFGSGSDLGATLDGYRTGDEVRFTKHPDGGRDHIDYVGVVTSKGDRIEGDWRIPGDWSGTFRMDRAKPKKAEETVRQKMTADI